MEYPIAIAAAAGLYTIMDSNRNNDRKKESFSNSFPSSTPTAKTEEKSIYEFGSNDLAGRNYINKGDKDKLVLNNGDKIPSNSYKAFNTEFKSDALRKTSESDEYFDNSKINCALS